MIPVFLVILTVNTGLRRSEIANLKIKDIHADSLRVEKGKGRPGVQIPASPSKDVQDLGDFFYVTIYIALGLMGSESISNYFDLSIFQSTS